MNELCRSTDIRISNRRRSSGCLSWKTDQVLFEPGLELQVSVPFNCSWTEFRDSIGPQFDTHTFLFDLRDSSQHGSSSNFYYLWTSLIKYEGAGACVISPAHCTWDISSQSRNSNALDLKEFRDSIVARLISPALLFHHLPRALQL